MRKRALSILLAAVLSLALLPATALAADVAVDETNFPDSAFRQYVLDTLDTDKNGSLSAGEIAAVGWIEVPELGIKSLKGVEYFTELWGLDCAVNKLTKLDVSKNTALKVLYCYANKLTALDVSKNTRLEALRCQENKLKTLDLRKNTKLTYLNVSLNKFTALDVSKNTKLTSLLCVNNKLTELNVSKNTKLGGLDCSGNQLSKLDLSRCPELENLMTGGNKLKELDLRACKSLVNALNDTGSVSYYAYDKSCYIANGVYLVEADYATAIRLGSGAQPTITAQPKNRKAVEGEQATFSVKAKGKDLTYRWFMLGKGETECAQLGSGMALTVTAGPGLDGAKYFCLVRNSEGILFSDMAKLTLITQPKITGQPKDATVKAGKKVTFKVKATGGDLKYQWYFLKPGGSKWTKIDKATKASYSFKAAKKQNGFQFRCEVYNKAGTATSEAARLKVK